MKILFVTARLCYPLNNGAKIRAFHLLRALAGEHDVTVVSYYGHADEERYFQLFEELGIRLIPLLNPAIDRAPTPSAAWRSLTGHLPLTLAKYYSGKMVALLKQVLADGYDAIHCEHLHMLPMIPHIGIPIVLDAHNVESQIADRYAAMEGRAVMKTLLGWNSRKLERFERQSVRSADMVLAVSDQDCGAFHGFGALDNIRVLENGVDTGYFRPARAMERASMVFVGSMDWKPNIDGVEYFLEDIFPLIRRSHPEVNVAIVGRNPPESLLKLGSETAGVTVTGTVEDVRPYVAGAVVCIVPLRVGGGTRLKILEAFSMEKAVVSTSLGCEGIACRNGENLLIADTPHSFATAVTTLLADSELRRTLGGKAGKLVEERYCWDTLGQKLNGFYREFSAATP